MSLPGTKRIFRSQQSMSAYWGEADMPQVTASKGSNHLSRNRPIATKRNRRGWRMLDPSSSPSARRRYNRLIQLILFTAKLFAHGCIRANVFGSLGEHPEN